LPSHARIEFSERATRRFALSYMLVCNAAVDHIQGGLRKLQSLKTDDADACDIAMGILVKLENDVLEPINEAWGLPISFCFVLWFIQVIYYAMTLSLGIDSGFFAYVFLFNAMAAMVGAHLCLLPAAMATNQSIALMGAINSLRYTTDEDGSVKMANEAIITQAECLSTVSVLSFVLISRSSARRLKV
jgi:hypothetical protein